MAAKNQPKTTVSLPASLDDPPLAHVLRGILAYAIVSAHSVHRSASPRTGSQFEPFPIGITSIRARNSVSLLVLKCFGVALPVIAQRDQSADEKARLQSAQIAAYLSKKLKAFCHGIDHSLSAIMFFTRAQLGRKASPQLERDLREVMERIDQVQLLVSEMQRSVGNIGSLDSTAALVAALGSDSAEPAATITIPDSVDEYKGAAGLYSLRKTSRKVVILPITVNYASEAEPATVPHLYRECV
jgi:hypothetical protein